MKIAVISDTHTLHSQLLIPDADMLIHCGDGCGRGTAEELLRLEKWFAQQPHKYKLYIPGNHDGIFETDEQKAREILNSATVLIDQAIEIEGIKFYGSPWQPEFNNWAFNLPRGPKLKEKWDLIPEDVEILITHGPPQGVLDHVRRMETNPDTFARREINEAVGCEELRKRVDELKPPVHLFGHIHEEYGHERYDQTLFVNAAVLNDYYNLAHRPILIEKVEGRWEVIPYKFKKTNKRFKT